MTEKKQRFENRLNKDKKYFNTLNPVWDNWQETTLNVFEMIDVMNEQSDELVEYCNFSLHDLLDKKNKEIEQLKTKNNAYLQDIEMFKEENATLKLENQELHQLNQEYINSLSDEKKETLSEMLNAILGDDGE